MKKFYAGNFRNIYKQINIDFEKFDMAAVIGKNGIGKTNLLEAIDWFCETSNYSDFRYGNLKSTNDTGDVIDESSPSYAIFILNIDDKTIKDINVTIEKHFGSEFKFRLNNKNTEDKYIIITKSSDFLDLSYNKNFVDEDNNKYLNVLRFLTNNIILEYLSYYKPTTLGDISKYFIKSDDDDYMLNVDTSYLDKYKDYENQQRDYLLASEDTDDDEDDYDSKPPRPPFSKKIYEALTSVYNFLLDIEKIFNVDNFIRVDYIVSANSENETKSIYEMNTLMNNRSTKNLVNFLNNFFSFSRIFNSILSLSKMDNDSEQYIFKNQQLTQELNDSSKDAIEKLFDSFDIYAQPYFSWTSNKLTIKVDNKEKLKVGNFKIEFSSSGFKAFFEIIMRFTSAEIESKNNPNLIHLILADEPEQNLHIKLQRQLIEYIQQKIIINKNIKFLYTTHSPYIIGSNSKIYSVDYYRNDEIRGSLKIDFIDFDANNIFSDASKLIDASNLMLSLEHAGIVDRYNVKNIENVDQLNFFLAKFNSNFILFEKEISNIVLSEFDQPLTILEYLDNWIKENKYSTNTINKEIIDQIKNYDFFNFIKISNTITNAMDIIRIIKQKILETSNKPILVLYEKQN